MIGPFEHGHWTATVGDPTFKNLVAGQRYVVVADFADYDGDTHLKGETWTFLGATFAPYDDGQSLFVSMDGRKEWHIRLQWRDAEQAHILDNLDQYVRTESVRSP